MMTLKVALLAILPLVLISNHSCAQDKTEPAKDEPKTAAGKVVAAFVDVPAGKVRPGCTEEEYNARHNGNAKLKAALQYDIWGRVPPLQIAGFQIGRYEVTNAQWKHYLDAAHRREHVVAKGETLKILAKRFVKDPKGEGIESEWKAMFALNADAIVKEWSKPGEKQPDGTVPPPVWKPGWSKERPPEGKAGQQISIATLFLPVGLKLVIYERRIPQHWYGWCRLAHLQTGLEYCNASLPAEKAFVVPKDAPFADRMRDTDFAAYPIRSISARDMLEFCEWAGVDLPSEYEWEYAARGDKAWLYTFGPNWVPHKQKELFAWADHPRAQFGTFRVDDESCKGSDSWIGARMMHGNVWELTRTFFDIHPKVDPEPPAPVPDVTNFAIIAKGASFGDGWAKMAISTRTGMVGDAEISLTHLNRTDSLGFRVVRHPQPGRDLLRHSLFRLSYESGRGKWLSYPHAYAMERMAGMDEVHVQSAGAPYIHVKKKAHGIGFVPRYYYEPKGLPGKLLGNMNIFQALANEFKAKKGRQAAYLRLGVIRTDVALECGVRLDEAEAAKLIADRAAFAKKMREWQRLPAKRRAKVQKPGPPPPEPDEWEERTKGNQKTCGMWRNGTAKAGEYHVIYWNGFFALANKALTMPPLAIFEIDHKKNKPTKSRLAPKDPTPPCTLEADPVANTLRLTLYVEEQVDRKKPKLVPDESKSSEWALADVTSKFWRGPRKPGRMWKVQVDLPTVKGALAKFAFNNKPMQIIPPKGNEAGAIKLPGDLKTKKKKKK